MYEQMRKALIKFQGEEFGPQKGASMTFRVKEELVNTSENEEVLYSRIVLKKKFRTDIFQ